MCVCMRACYWVCVKREREREREESGCSLSIDEHLRRVTPSLKYTSTPSSVDALIAPGGVLANTPGEMALTCMIHGFPRSPASIMQSGLLNHIPSRRLQKCLHLRESKLRDMMEVMSLLGKHSTDFEAKGGEGMLLADNTQEGKSIAGSVVALGKFDALHIGHRALAIQAAKMGPSVLLSFTGMAEVLQWEKRLPLVAPCDRKRVMSLWASVCGGNAPLEYHLEFAKVRSLSPHDFVQRLAKELFVKGVVAGANYRFGYKAAGDASDLVQLCSKFGLEVFIVDSVMDKMVKPDGGANELEEANSREKGQVSSTRVRKALSKGDLRRVTELLGRDYRLVLTIDDGAVEPQTIHAVTLKALNEVPMEGRYSSKMFVSQDGGAEASFDSFVDGIVEINKQNVVATCSKGSFQCGWKGQRLLLLDLQSKISD